MQKATNRILSMLLVLVMVLSMLPATVFADNETANVLEGWNISLGDNIGVKFHLNSSDYAVTTTVNGVAVTPVISENVATVNVAAAQMNDTIVLTVKNGEETVHTGEYSVRQYAETILAGNYDDEVKEMVKEMLNFGAAAQTYFVYNTDNLANDGYELDTAATVPTEVPEITVQNHLAGIGLYGMSLVFRSKTAVRFYFNVSGDIADYTFKVGENAYEPVEKNGQYYVEVGNINPHDLDKTVTVTVNDTLSVSYSPLNYIVRKYNNADSSDSLKALVQAMYGYHLEALDYQEYLKIVQIESMTAAVQYGSNGLDKREDGTVKNIYGSAAANTAPGGSWSYEYTPVEAAGLKLIRDGETYNVGIPSSGTIVKFADTGYCLKLEAWTIANSMLPLVENDILIIEGRYNLTSDSSVVVDFDKTFIYYDGASVEFSTEMPILPTTIDAGMMSSHNNTSANGLFFTIAANAAPYDGWSTRYTPTETQNVQLIRDGQTLNVGNTGYETIVKFSDTEYFLEYGALSGYGPLKAGDVLIVEGDFVNAANKVTLNIKKTCILIQEDGTGLFVSAFVDAGVVSKVNSANIEADTNYIKGFYLDLPENAAPQIGWGTDGYAPVSAGNLKLIRDGVTTDIGSTAYGCLLKVSATEHYLRFEKYNSDTIITENDIIVLGGDFVGTSNDEKTVLRISQTYIYHDGTAWVCSTTEPVPETIYNVGVLSENADGGSATGFNATGLENDAPYSGWSAEYAPTSKECIQVIRNGETIYRTNTGAGAIVKLGGTSYYVKFDSWIDSTNYPLQAGDMIIIEGVFVGTGNYAEAEGVKIQIDKTYVIYDGESFTFSATEPVPSTTVNGGVMSEHADGSASEIYFSLAANTAPVDEETVYPYSGSVQLVQGGEASSMDADIYKLADDQYYLDLFGVELADGDYLIVEGAFSNADNGYTLNITKTYVLADGENLVYSETEPVLETEYVVTGLTNHANGWSADGIYISHNAHEATINSDWSVEYKPVSADAIKLVRNGVTTSVGQPASGTLVVYNATAMYLKTAAWTITGNVLPFVSGDTIVIEGKFKHEASGDILVVEKTVICVNGDSLIFNPIFAGTMTDHTNGLNSNGEGIYATMAENAAPFDGWNIEYTPVTADSYYVIRDGEQINIGIPGRGTLVKYNATDYYLKINSWCTNNFAYTTDDIIVIDGFWKNDANSTIMKMDKTYLYFDGTAWVFATELPNIIDGGVMQSHSNGLSGNGIYFKLDANSAPFDGWSIEYAQTATSGIKLIRDGVTTDIGIVDRPLIVKFGETDYYLKLENWTIGNYGINGTSPITADDVLIVEGNFKCAADNVTLNISKSYVYFDGTAWVCSAEEPVQKTVVDMVELGSHDNGWTAGTANPWGGMYFKAAENDAPYSGWDVRYTPVSADAIKLIRNGVETNAANTGAETIVKYSATEYYLEFWPFSQKPILVGDQIIIEGLFYNAANDVYIDVEKTTIKFNESGTATYITDASKYINAGAMSAYTSNWFGDGVYFVLGSNAAPADADWNVRYTPSSANNIKLIRNNGEAVSIANTGAETIVKIADGWYWLSLESWWWSANAPIQDGDQLIIEGEFTNASNGYTLNIDKTYITFVSKENDDVVFSTVADTDFGEVLLPSSSDTLTIGMWNGSYHVFEDKQLRELQAAGITKIMGINTQWIGTTDVNAWLDRVYSYGISVIIDLRDWDGETVPEYANHPGLIGFLMYDEPGFDDFDALATLKEKFDDIEAFDGKLFYVNLFPSSASGAGLVGEDNWNAYRRDYDDYYVTPFLEKLGIEVLSWDNYSLITNSENEKGIRTDYFYNFEVMASKAKANNLPLWYTMLSAGHTSGAEDTYYATPTAEELRWQMAVALTYGVQNIDHYIYVSHEDDYSCMVEYETWEPTDLYYDIKDVNNEYLAWDNIFMAYDWVGVATYRANYDISLLRELENTLELSQYGATVTSATENLLIGVFDYNGENAYMVTNAGSATLIGGEVGDGKSFTMADTTVTLTLDAADYKCVAVIDNGEISYVAVENNTVTIDVEAYEGVFVIPVLN